MTAGIALSPEQQRVIAYRGGDLQVIACAGSGKTESISRRIASLIAEGADPAGIGAFTFTERAADELKERITRRVGDVMGATFLDRLGPMFVGTIHAYCFRLLQDHVPHYGNYDVLDEHRHAGILSREYRNLGLHKLGDQHWRPIRDWMRTVDVIGNELIDPAILAGTPVGEVYQAYRAMLDRYHCLTFGLIIQCAVESLQDPAIYARVRASLRYLVVDEYQDINPAQERLIELLAAPPVQLCVVGDDDQCIYQWRGSDVSNIVTFAGRRGAVHTETLDVNRRSRPSIVTTANDFAGTITGRLDKAMQPVRPTGTNEIVGWIADTDVDEAERMAATIARLHDAGYRYRDIAVLFRSVRTSAPPLIEACRRRHIPIVCGGRTGLFLELEISLFGEILSWFVDGEWKDDRFGTRRQVLLEPIVAGLDAAFGNGGPVPGLKKYLEDWKAYRLRGNEPANLVGDFYRLLLFLGAQRTDVEYVPDFVVRMRGGRLVLLEIKGRAGELWNEDLVPAKNTAAKKWVAAVNNANRWGQWAFEICRDLAGLRAILERHAAPLAGARVLPFRIVSPKKGEHFRTCVPLTTLRAAAGRFSEEQAGLDDRAEWAEEWVTWEGAPAFEQGMFVARVQGDSMEPEIPNGSYCLFRAPRGGSRQGRKLLVWHSGISDPHTGGQYTVKVYTSEKAPDGEEGWRHTKIVLKPLNPAHQPIALTPESEDQVRVIAEFVEVISGG